ncbi:zinc finger CCCH domain-containing protein 7-like isoform X2 [Zingiber officinale]|uniref:zinc finger CCCH domain-containing protein 7-like isoform X2 n=1 Tax=Zingiber officinale TaxID=94328 RepID=UPI001C4D70E0|nr:zinc finger CCCH domain-containing protein 7-like isoform X2 [Zingiber officinale]
MEELNVVQTLNPPAKSCLPHLPLLRRSSHLDSASYRTLVRIFSFCLDESFISTPESRENPRPIFSAKISDPLFCEKDFSFDQSNGGALPVELGHGCSGNISPSLHVASSHNLGLDEKLGNEKWGNCQAVNGLMSESLKLQSGVDEGQASDTMVELGNQQADSGLGVDRVQKGVHSSILGLAGGLHSKVADAQSDNPPCLDSDIQSVETIGKSEERNKDILEAKGVNRTRTESFELKTLTNSTELLGGKVNGHAESVKDSITYLSSDKLLVVQPQEDMSNSTNESVDKHQETLLDSSMNTSVQEQLHKNILDSLPYSNSTNEPVEKHQETLLDSSIECLVKEQYHKSLLDSLLDSDSEEVEEGQIAGDFWNSDEFGSLVTHQNNLHEGQKTDKISDWSDILNKEGVDEDNITDDLNLDDIHLNVELKSCHNVPLMDAKKHEVALPTLTLDEEKTICQNAGKVGPKRKRGALTEERKAQKKKSRRRKRAEKEREQGVKRLKLPPVVKPKAVKLCNFYMIGRCQQGDLCKFSHDATPHTKSQPCKYFACDSCLKGDECQFDHELSKYPCHNFQSKGTCYRGDKCKFSHKIVDVEGSSLPDAKKLVSPSTEENLNAGIQNCLNKNHANVNAPAKTIISSTTHVSSKNLEVNLGSAKKPMKMPKGISFITLGNGLSNITNKLTNSLLPEKSMRYEENPAKASKEERKNTDCSTAKPFVKQQNGSSIFLPKKSIAGDSLISGGTSSSSATTSMSKALQNEASEASKILEEFLFGATG